MRERRTENLRRELIAAFPALTTPLREAGPSLAAQAAEFGLYTQAAKASGDWPLFERCIAVADHLLGTGGGAVRAAFQPAFYEHLEFEGSRGPAAWQLMSSRLQEGWKQMDAENRRLMALPQNRAPLSTGRPGRGGRPPGGARPRGGQGGRGPGHGGRGPGHGGRGPGQGGRGPGRGGRRRP